MMKFRNRKLILYQNQILTNISGKFILQKWIVFQIIKEIYGEDLANWIMNNAKPLAPTPVSAFEDAVPGDVEAYHILMFYDTHPDTLWHIDKIEISIAQ